MPGDDKHLSGVFVYVLAEEWMPQDHPLREIKRIVDKTLKKMHPFFYQNLFKNGSSFDSAGAFTERAIVQILYTV
jgi:hypothetical protein